MTHFRKLRLALSCFAAISLTACQGELFQMPPLNPDSGATFRIYAILYSPHGKPERRLRNGVILGEHAQKFTDRHGETLLVALPAIVDESCLEAISASLHPYDDQPVLNFKFDEDCSRTFGDFTARHINRRMAVVVNGEMVSAPNIRTAITGGAGYIEGDFDNLEDAEAMVKTFY